jgi:hypothetical protein
LLFFNLVWMTNMTRTSLLTNISTRALHFSVTRTPRVRMSESKEMVIILTGASRGM